nr:MAG TPA: hypothetical protein [Caudoviricetes sp.]
MEKENLLRSKRIYEKRLSEELQLKTMQYARTSLQRELSRMAT